MVDYGPQATNVDMFGYSWTAALDENEAACLDTCPVPPVEPTLCSGDRKTNAESSCAVIKDSTGPFAVSCLH